MCRGQVEGGVAQAIGSALYEADRGVISRHLRRTRSAGSALANASPALRCTVPSVADDPGASVADASEWRRFVIGREPCPALAFFFGDELGSFSPLLRDSIATVLVAGLLAGGHHYAPVGLGHIDCRPCGHLTCGLFERRKQHAAMGFGGVTVSGRGGPDDCAVWQFPGIPLCQR